MENRAENCMTGFCLLDLFQMVAAKETARRHLPQGSLFLAPETVRNLQQSALGLLTFLVGKDPSGNPWKAGDHRLGELHIERHFGRLRSQSASAQLNARTFWRASARDLMKSSIVNKPRKPTDDVLHPISPDEFFAASQRAYKSSLKLVAFCANVTSESLDEMYREYCQSKGFLSEGPPLGDEHEFLEAMEEEVALQNHEDETKTFLNDLQCDASMNEELPVEEVDEDIETSCLEQVPDGNLLRDLFNVTETKDGNPEDPPPSPSKGACHVEGIACNLHHALWLLHPGSKEEEIFDGLWRLAMYLRYWGAGSDRSFISDPRTCRRKSSRLNWYQCLARCCQNFVL